jgi:hypothetical protein
VQKGERDDVPIALETDRMEIGGTRGEGDGLWSVVMVSKNEQ